MTKALYRKYRSKSLADVVGQEHITDVLERSIKKGRIAHAYLLTGPRGVGKTSIARILAHEINQLPYDDDSNHLDIIEIDAASNNGVDDVRDLRDKVQLAPISASKKIYIIDEVHMLSKPAFNALLKTLEEPPAHVVFILATTDVDRLPATIVSRTQRFGFRSIAPQDAIKHLSKIAEQEKIQIDVESLELIARHGDGSFRDSISLLDQLSSLADEKSGITRELVERSLGLAPVEVIEQLLESYRTKNLAEIVRLLDESEKSGIQASVLATQLTQSIRLIIAERADLIPLLDKLLEVPKSPQPFIKLLTSLAPARETKPKSAALSSPAKIISASVTDLQSAPKPTKKLPPAEKAKAAPTEDTPQPTPPAPSKVIKKSSDSSSVSELDWQALLDLTREKHVAIYSVIKRCGYEQDGSAITIFTNTAFWKKKLDDAKYRVPLIESIREIGVDDPTIETIASPPPPKDSVAAAVAAIMGGGEEVDVSTSD